MGATLLLSEILDKLMAQSERYGALYCVVSLVLRRFVSGRGACLASLSAAGVASGVVFLVGEMKHRCLHLQRLGWYAL